MMDANIIVIISQYICQTIMLCTLSLYSDM